MMVFVRQYHHTDDDMSLNILIKKNFSQIDNLSPPLSLYIEWKLVQSFSDTNILLWFLHNSFCQSSRLISEVLFIFSNTKTSSCLNQNQSKKISTKCLLFAVVVPNSFEFRGLLGPYWVPPQLVGPDHFFGHVLGIGQDQQDIGHPPPGQKDRT